MKKKPNPNPPASRQPEIDEDHEFAEDRRIYTAIAMLGLLIRSPASQSIGEIPQMAADLGRLMAEALRAD